MTVRRNVTGTFTAAAASERSGRGERPSPPFQRGHVAVVVEGQRLSLRRFTTAAIAYGFTEVGRHRPPERRVHALRGGGHESHGRDDEVEGDGQGGDTVEGTAVWTKRGQTDTVYTFKGTLTK